jgi:hypothetical protein
VLALRLYRLVSESLARSLLSTTRT